MLTGPGEGEVEREGVMGTGERREGGSEEEEE